MKYPHSVNTVAINKLITKFLRVKCKGNCTACKYSNVCKQQTRREPVDGERIESVQQS